MSTPNLTLTQRFGEYYSYFLFRTAMLAIDLAFWMARLKQWWRGNDSGGFEDEIEKSVRSFAKSNFGVEITQGAMSSG
jgi:aarF domain-containing kinase